MKHLHFKKQKFQEDAVNSVCDVFMGQIPQDKWSEKNSNITLSNDDLLNNITKIQKDNNLELSKTIDKDDINLTIEMETGTGKTYTYINTIYELNKRYDWSKFIIVVPSIAIREGVLKSFEDMEEHFKSIYGKKINYFIYNSKNPSKVRNFTKNNDLTVMIINNQAFNTKGYNKIHHRTEQGEALIESIGKIRPIVILDEPQSIEGNATKENLKEFNSLFTLRYSATHRETYDMVYKLDAVDAFDMNLVKKIEVTGVTIEGSTGTHGYLRLDEIIKSNKDPEARIEIEVNTSKGINKKVIRMKTGENIYNKSQLEQYKGYIIDKIDAKNGYVEFTNNKKIELYKLYGEPNIQHKRRAQIRETIRSHLEKEITNYKHGIKTISLFFIDKVAKYRQYDEQGNNLDGEYVQMFTEEYTNLLEEYLKKEIVKNNPDLLNYLKNITPEETHSGYFSIDKKNKQFKDPKKSELYGKGSEKSCKDVDAFDLIMKDKKRLLDLKNPVRFIFSHSTLKEGWDNPNVFQICILRDSDATITKKKQEVGRGLRLCVNQNGERIDSETENIDSSDINVLTVIANESYESFAGALQKEFCENLRSRPLQITFEFLKNNLKIDGKSIEEKFAKKIHKNLGLYDYINDNAELTEECKELIKNNKLELIEPLHEYKEPLTLLLQNIINKRDSALFIQNGNKPRKRARLNINNINNPNFKKLWDYINIKSYYTVDFDSDKLIKNSIEKIDEELTMDNIVIKIERSKIEKINEEINSKNVKHDNEVVESQASTTSKYDLINQIVNKTKLKKVTIIKILTNIKEEQFNKFKQNPEEFIRNVSNIINKEKGRLIIKNIKYHKTNDRFPLEIFEDNVRIQDNYIENLKKYIYDILKYDSNVEKDLANELDNFNKLEVFAKLPKGKYTIDTPVDSKFSPDWIMVFDNEDSEIKNAYCVFESKGTIDDSHLREIENIKIECAKKHFEAISGDNILFKVVSDFNNINNHIKSQKI
ncbi:type III restriction enzyme [Methanococcus voltae]|uniref:restriction endonuclease n=1 Tax=Methanococcus voltae TaxID=2188 RepID=UPI001AE2F2C1|nr:DEAD/DEAH box helicase family protein [Methanococcus voltae]MBP2143351.1 type III restriction enzyme [Methanococcus voltae]